MAKLLNNRISIGPQMSFVANKPRILIERSQVQSSELSPEPSPES